MFACNLVKRTNGNGSIGPTGPTGPNGLRGYDGNSSRWIANSQGSTPVNGEFHIISTGNGIVINTTDYNANDMTAWLLNTKVGDILTVREVDNPANVGYFYLASLFTTLINPDKKLATISYISGSITGPVPATIGSLYYIGYVVSGPTGSQGAIGPPGSGSGSSFDSSFNYLFMEKPWSPAYMTGYTFNPPSDGTGISDVSGTNRGTFDASSGQYDITDQRIELNWVLPPREAAAFNFITPPHQLNDTVVNLTTGTYSGMSDLSLNYLPYHESLFIDYRIKTGVTVQPWTTLTTTELALIQAGTPLPNLYNQTIGAYFVAGANPPASTGDYGPITGPPSVPQFVYENKNKFNVGANQFQFRIYLNNNSTQVLPSPDYFGTVNPEWNYLYMPDTSGAFIVFGSFGPATPPQLITMVNTDYRRIKDR